jgi:hypothetical protein
MSYADRIREEEMEKVCPECGREHVTKASAETCCES